jgi:hypothetical protein
MSLALRAARTVSARVAAPMVRVPVRAVPVRQMGGHASMDPHNFSLAWTTGIFTLTLIVPSAAIGLMYKIQMDRFRG